ncbi:transcriptional regulator [Pseudomonas syringae pv. syringae]|nr:PapB/FocB family fimbrial expression transcriptional regulator [Pseudomonas syringae]KWS10968.1 transcriptional regulator [Pseudomonas syringae pv. syringae]UQB22965.1 transcriptional regulator [Pseudomonas syringae pv. syringae]
MRFAVAEKHKLVPGEVDPDHFAALLRLTGIRSEAIVAALRGHLIEGRKQIELCREFSITPSLLSRKVADINKVSNLAEDVSIFYR